MHNKIYIIIQNFDNNNKMFFLFFKISNAKQRSIVKKNIGIEDKK